VVPVTKELACSEVGFDCSYTARAEDEEGILDQVAEHAAEEHPDVELTDDVIASVRDQIQDIETAGIVSVESSPAPDPGLRPRSDGDDRPGFPAVREGGLAGWEPAPQGRGAAECLLGATLARRVRQAAARRPRAGAQRRLEEADAPSRPDAPQASRTASRRSFSGRNGVRVGAESASENVLETSPAV
jgi:predicted small metal-binding protein